MIHTHNIRATALAVGDRMAEKPLWGEIIAIHPHRGAQPGVDTSTWRDLTFADGTRATISGTWFPR